MPRKAKRGRYEVYTERDLQGADRSGATRALKVAIVLAMAGMLGALRHPLLEALAVPFPWLSR